MMMRLDLVMAAGGAKPARSDACEAAIDAFAERVGRDLVIPPDEVAARLSACPPADAVAAEKVLAAREDRMLWMQPTHDDFERVRSTVESCPECMGDVEIACRRATYPDVLARWEWQFVVDDTSAAWLHAERCCAVLVPRHTAAIVVEQARRWVAAGKHERIAACLERCALAPATRAELERLRR